MLREEVEPGQFELVLRNLHAKECIKPVICFEDVKNYSAEKLDELRNATPKSMKPV